MPKSSTPNLSIKAQIPLEGTSKKRTARIRQANIYNFEFLPSLESWVKDEFGFVAKKKDIERAAYIKTKLVKYWT